MPVVAGLVTGVLAAAGVLALAFSLAPDRGTAGPTLPPPPSSPDSAATGLFTSPLGSASGGTSGSAPPGDSPSPALAGFHVGEPAPPLRLPQLGGGTVELAALRGKPVWVHFLATWCPPCQDELPLMNGYAARYADEGLVVVAVDVREDEGTVATFAERLGVTFPVALDTNGTAQRAWEAAALPVHFWVDADGVVRDGALGGIGPDVMAAGLRTILPGVEVTP